MPFNFSLDDFHKLATEALKAGDSDFTKSTVADRMRTVFADRMLAAPSGKDSLELRRCLAKLINDLYRSHGHVKIPPAVASALNVSKVASGFKLDNDGSLVATNHPLTERRLVCIMSAIRFNSAEFTPRFDDYQAGLSSVLGKSGTPFYNQFKSAVAKPLGTLAEFLRSASQGTVKPATLKAYFPTLRNKISLVKDYYAIVSPNVSAAERAELAKLINLAVDLTALAGVEIAKVEVPVAIEMPIAAPPLDLEKLDDLLAGRPQMPSNKVLVDQRIQTTILGLQGKIGKYLDDSIDLRELLNFTEKELESFGNLNGDQNEIIAKKVQVIADAVEMVANAELETADRLKFLKQAIAQDGEIDKDAFAEAQITCRKNAYEAMARDFKANFEGKVAGMMLAQIKDDATCAAGLANLNKDFPQARSYLKRVKKDYAGKDGPLLLLNLKGDGVLSALLAGKLEQIKSGFDTVDLSKDRTSFENSLNDVVKQTAEKLTERLKAVLTAEVFEDDRTLLTLMALDPLKSDAFEAALKAAQDKYKDKVFDRLVQVMLPGKIEAANRKLQPKPRESDNVGTVVSPEFRSHFGFGDDSPKGTKAVKKSDKVSGVVFTSQLNKIANKDPKDDYMIGLGGERMATGAAMKAAVRDFFADLFAPPTKKPDGLKKLVLRNAAVIQTLLLDPALLESVSVPGDKGDGDNIRALVSHFLEAIKDNVNLGNLTPSDFRKALTAELDGDAFATFSAGLKDAGEKVLASLQRRLTEELTDGLRKLSSSGSELKLDKMTLAELGASGLGSMDAGYGKFMANVLNNYFKDPALAADHDRMLESFFRNGKAGGTVGDALGALIKGAGPIFQKVLQSIPTTGLPDEIVKALSDVKSGLAPISDDAIKQRLDDALKTHNADPNNTRIEGIEIVKSLGAASVGQALLCRFHLADGRVEEKVVKLLRPGISVIATREREFFKNMAKLVGNSMKETFDARMAGIMEELDFTNEARWIEKGQCYGKAENYKGVVEISDDLPDPMFLKSMTASKLMKADTDLLVLDMAPGKPVDRNLRDLRARLESITSKIQRTTVNEFGEKVQSYVAHSGFDLIATRDQLVRMYNELRKQRTLVEELLRRFGSELFYRDYDKKMASCFMHGDLHGGNLLISDNTLTVIDFGNSHEYDKNVRQKLICFVAACGFGHTSAALKAIEALLGNYALNKHPKYNDIKKDIESILSKGDANDVASRGMAVVQYLQRMDVPVPDPLINFTETVMRLDAVHRETNALLDDIGSVIDSLKIDPKSNKNYDPYASDPEVMFKPYGKDLVGSYSDNQPAYKAFYTGFRDLHIRIDNANQKNEDYVLDPNDYKAFVLPTIELLRECPYESKILDRFPTVGAKVRYIARQLKLQADRLFQPPAQRDAGLLPENRPLELITQLFICLNQLHSLSMVGGEEEWNPTRGSSTNQCMSEGLMQHSEPALFFIVGTEAIKMGKDKEKVEQKALQTQVRKEVTQQAQSLYLGRVGVLDSRTRRIIDRIIDDHFIMPSENKGIPWQTAKWHTNPNSVLALKEALELNLGKLRDHLNANKIAPSEKLTRYAMIAFCTKYGISKALRDLTDAECDTLAQKIGGEGAELIRFIRNDPSVVNSLFVGNFITVALTSEHAITFTTLDTTHKIGQKDMAPLPSGSKLNPKKPNSTGDLFAQIYQRYCALKEPNVTYKKASLELKLKFQYAMLRFLLDQGVLQDLVALDPKTRVALIKSGANKAHASDLEPLLNDIIKNMTTVN